MGGSFYISSRLLSLCAAHWINQSSFQLASQQVRQACAGTPSAYMWGHMVQLACTPHDSKQPCTLNTYHHIYKSCVALFLILSRNTLFKSTEQIIKQDCISYNMISFRAKFLSGRKGLLTNAFPWLFGQHQSSIIRSPEPCCLIQSWTLAIEMKVQVVNVT